jgi:hypothetical protein
MERLQTGVLPKVLEMSHEGYDSNDLTDDLSVLGSIERKHTISVKETELYLVQVSKLIGQANYSAWDKHKILLVAWFLEPQCHGKLQGQNYLDQILAGLIHWQSAVAKFLLTLEN